jgi:stress response protein YsnF
VNAIPQNREEGGVLVIPVVEEEIVVRRRLVLREEIHITRKQVQEQAKRDVTLAREHAIVERLDEQGKVIARSKSREKPRQPETFFKKKGILSSPTGS